MGIGRTNEFSSQWKGGKNVNYWFQWASISGEWRRDYSDWKRLCRLCHEKFDAHLHVRGEMQGQAKLNTQKVKQARLLRSEFKWNCQQIANLWDVSAETIRPAIKKITWKHI